MTKYSPAAIAELLALQEKAAGQHRGSMGSAKWSWMRPGVLDATDRRYIYVGCSEYKGKWHATANTDEDAAFIASAPALADQLRAAQAIIERQRAVIHEVYNDCIEGFVRCTHCGWQEDTKDLDFMDAVTEALSLTEPTDE